MLLLNIYLNFGSFLFQFGEGHEKMKFRDPRHILAFSRTPYTKMTLLRPPIKQNGIFDDPLQKFVLSRPQYPIQKMTLTIFETSIQQNGNSKTPIQKMAF